MNVALSTLRSSAIKGALFLFGVGLGACQGSAARSHPPAADLSAPVRIQTLSAQPDAAPPKIVDRLLAAGALEAGALFELTSLFTTRDHELATPERLHKLAQGLGAALGAPDRRLRAAALASIGALAALSEEGRAALMNARVAERLFAQLQDEPGPLLRGRALLALGALAPALTRPADKQAMRELLTTGLADANRFVSRQAVIGATLTRDEALDSGLLGALRRQLGLAAPVTGDGAAPPIPAIPAVLPPPVAVELMPLLPAYVDLLMSLPQPEAQAAAERLVAAAQRHDPSSATAHFLHAELLSKRRDPKALEALRTALSLGNLPAVFVNSLSTEARALAAAPDVAAARAEVRRLLASRPAELYRAAAPRVTASLLDSEASAALRPEIRAVSPTELEQRAEAVVRADGATSAKGLQLGAELFLTYPFGSEEYYDACLRSFLLAGGSNRDLLDRLGLSYEQAADGRRTVVGVVAATGQEPAPRYGVTCALCHAQVDREGRRGDGLPTRIYDQGLLLAACVDQPIHDKAQNRNIGELMQYLPGRNDSSSDGVHDPTEIPSLYGLAAPGPVRWNGDTPTLEVQIDRNLSQKSAPPAVIALVAAYLRSLSPPPADQRAAASPIWAAGQAAFQRHCQRCHAPPLYTSGQIVSVELLNTDRTRVSAVLPNSTEGYKVPSLLRIAATAPYLHDGSVPTLLDLLDPRRPGGHRFGQDLPKAERAALLSFLRSL